MSSSRLLASLVLFVVAADPSARLSASRSVAAAASVSPTAASSASPTVSRTGQSTARQTVPSDRPQLVVQTGNTEPVTCAVVSPDGTKVLTGSIDHTARLWDAATGLELRRFEGGDLVHAVAFLGQGNTILVAEHATATVWDASSGRALYRLAGGRFAVSRDGTRLATGGDWYAERNVSQATPAVGPTSSPARIWNVTTGQEIGRFDEPSGSVVHIALEPRLLSRVLAGDELDRVRDVTRLNRALPGVAITEIKHDTPTTVAVRVRVSNSKKEFSSGSTSVVKESRVFDVRLFRDGQLVGYAPERDGEVVVDPRTGSATLTFRGIKLPRDPAGSTIEFSAHAFNVDRLKRANRPRSRARISNPDRWDHAGSASLPTTRGCWSSRQPRPIMSRSKVRSSRTGC